MQKKLRNYLLATVLALFFIFLALYLAASYPVEIKRFDSPNKQYVAVTTKKWIYFFLPTMPGDGSPWPVDIEIFDHNGISMGRIPLEAGYMADALEWTENGASIELIGGGEWNFKEKTAYYWDDSTHKRIWVRRPWFTRLAL